MYVITYTLYILYIYIHISLSLSLSLVCSILVHVTPFSRVCCLCCILQVNGSYCSRWWRHAFTKRSSMLATPWWTRSRMAHRWWRVAITILTTQRCLCSCRGHFPHYIGALVAIKPYRIVGITPIFIGRNRMNVRYAAKSLRGVITWKHTAKLSMRTSRIVTLITSFTCDQWTFYWNIVRNEQLHYFENKIMANKLWKCFVISNHDVQEQHNTNMSHKSSPSLTHVQHKHKNLHLHSQLPMVKWDLIKTKQKSMNMPNAKK